MNSECLKWLLIGPQGLRVGWSVLLFLVMALLFMATLGTAAGFIVHSVLHTSTGHGTPLTAIVQMTIQFAGLFAAAAISAAIERRRLLAYNLTGPNRLRHFLTGILAGIVALSALAGGLYEGGWLHFGGISLSGIQILQFGVLWGIAFLLTGLSEEGMTRCYMQFTLTRGINYWWALGTVSTFSALAFINTYGSGAGGVYLMAACGVAPCLLLHLRKSPSRSE